MDLDYRLLDTGDHVGSPPLPTTGGNSEYFLKNQLKKKDVYAIFL